MKTQLEKFEAYSTFSNNIKFQFERLFECTQSMDMFQNICMYFLKTMWVEIQTNVIFVHFKNMKSIKLCTNSLCLITKNSLTNWLNIVRNMSEWWWEVLRSNKKISQIQKIWFSNWVLKTGVLKQNWSFQLFLKSKTGVFIWKLEFWTVH